jgi:hypothetical protein
MARHRLCLSVLCLSVRRGPAAPDGQRHQETEQVRGAGDDHRHPRSGQHAGGRRSRSSSGSTTAYVAAGMQNEMPKPAAIIRDDQHRVRRVRTRHGQPQEAGGTGRHAHRHRYLRPGPAGHHAARPRAERDDSGLRQQRDSGDQRREAVDPLE